jgi:hypothetical protein
LPYFFTNEQAKGKCTIKTMYCQCWSDAVHYILFFRPSSCGCCACTKIEGTFCLSGWVDGCRSIYSFEVAAR